jgi:hypothetical protein
VRRVALIVLATVHALGAMGAPFAAKLHLFQAGATPHQNFHVAWEACKYFAASVLALFVVVRPLARGERWAWWAMVIATLALFGGVFFAHAITHGGPAIDHWSYGSFFVLSCAALGVLRSAATRDEARGRDASDGTPVGVRDLGVGMAHAPSAMRHAARRGE